MDLNDRISNLIVILIDIWFKNGQENDNLEKVIKELVEIRALLPKQEE